MANDARQDAARAVQQVLPAFYGELNGVAARFGAASDRPPGSPVSASEAALDLGRAFEMQAAVLGSILRGTAPLLDASAPGRQVKAALVGMYERGQQASGRLRGLGEDGQRMPSTAVLGEMLGEAAGYFTTEQYAIEHALRHLEPAIGSPEDRQVVEATKSLHASSGESAAWFRNMAGQGIPPSGKEPRVLSELTMELSRQFRRRAAYVASIAPVIEKLVRSDLGRAEATPGTRRTPVPPVPLDRRNTAPSIPDNDVHL